MHLTEIIYRKQFVKAILRRYMGRLHIIHYIHHSSMPVLFAPFRKKVRKRSLASSIPIDALQFEGVPVD